MLGLANKYWRWRQEALYEEFRTVDGKVVHRFYNRGTFCYAIVKFRIGAFQAHYYDMASYDHAWTRHDRWFKDCLCRLEDIDARFGKLILPEEITPQETKAV